MMRYTMLVFLGLLPLAFAGCDIKENANSKGSPEAEEKKAETAPRERVPLPKDKKPVSPAASRGPGNLPFELPAFNDAEFHNRQMAKAEEELVERLTELRFLLASEKYRLQDAAIEWKVLALEVRERIELAERSLGDFSRQLAEYARESAYSEPIFRNAASGFRARMRDYSPSPLRDALRDYADEMDRCAREAPSKLAAVRAFQARIPEMQRKLFEGKSFLSDSLRFLASHPGASGSYDPRKLYAPQFEAFFTSFSEIVRVVLEFRTKLRESTVSARVRTELNREVELARRMNEEKREIARLRLEQALRETAAREAEEKATAMAKADARAAEWAAANRNAEIRLASLRNPQSDSSVTRVTPIPLFKPAPVVATPMPYTSAFEPSGGPPVRRALPKTATAARRPTPKVVPTASVPPCCSCKIKPKPIPVIVVHAVRIHPIRCVSGLPHIPSVVVSRIQ